MILVTLGTQDKSFTRLLEAIERAAQQNAIHEEIVVQAGYTHFESRYMKITDYFDQDTFKNMISKADLVITHGGAGSIMTALKAGKKILAAARLSAYMEHTNDHQTQLLESFDAAGYLIYMRDLSDIRPYLKQAETFEPAAFTTNTPHMISILEEYIETH